MNKQVLKDAISAGFEAFLGTKINPENSFAGMLTKFAELTKQSHEVHSVQIIADIRDILGVGHKPMMDELPALIRAELDNANGKDGYVLVPIDQPAEQPQECKCPEHGSWIEASGYYKHCLDLDIALNGEKSAARRPLLIDMLAQVQDIVREKCKPLLQCIAEQPAQPSQELMDIAEVIAGWNSAVIDAEEAMYKIDAILQSKPAKGCV